MASQLFEKDFFEGDSRRFDGGYRSYTPDELLPRFNDLATRVVDVFHPGRALDLGCAKGFFVLALRQLGVEAYGVDVSEHAVSSSPPEVATFLRRLDLDSELLPFPDAFFSFVSVLGVLEYLNNLEEVLSELARVVEPGGVVLLQAANPANEPDSNSLIRKPRLVSDWVSMFEKKGFESRKTTSLLENVVLRTSYVWATPTWKSRPAKFLFNNSGYLGRRLVGYLYTRYSPTRFLFFIRKSCT